MASRSLSDVSRCVGRLRQIGHLHDRIHHREGDLLRVTRLVELRLGGCRRDYAGVDAVMRVGNELDLELARLFRHLLDRVLLDHFHLLVNDFQLVVGWHLVVLDRFHHGIRSRLVRRLSDFHVVVNVRDFRRVSHILVDV